MFLSSIFLSAFRTNPPRSYGQMLKLFFGRFVAASTTILVTSLPVIFDSFSFSFLRLCGLAPLRKSPYRKIWPLPTPRSRSGLSPAVILSPLELLL